MFEVFSTLIRGANARATDRLTDHFAIDLIQQKIREAQGAVDAAKKALAALVLSERQQRRALETMQARKVDLEQRARSALTNGDDGLARDAAAAIADLENEETVRMETLASLEDRIARMRLSVERAHRRVIDLRQSAVAAQAIDAERKAQGRLNRSIANSTAIQEAEKLIKQVTERDDVLEQGEVLDEIDASLTHQDIADRLADAGHGAPTKTSADDVLARLRDPE